MPNSQSEHVHKLIPTKMTLVTGGRGQGRRAWLVCKPPQALQPGHPTPQENPHPDPGHHSGQTSRPPPVHQASILSNKRVICRWTIIPTHKMAAPMWSKILPPCGHKMATTRWPAEEGSWEAPGLKGGQLGAIKPAGEGS
uniref:Uncharacterized protein n=1 Tax=Pipistrellus kuhlii TaxID=59472 RepID=A0A7J7V0K3_PIPKU|nr:hypothetical protein mPipKuh1_008623 [Pipistrellus kuhlii]